MTVYLDCAATTPIEPRVLDLVIHYMKEEFGNAGSRTHEFGARAKQAVEKARRQVAQVVEAQADEVIFTSGATESNNLAILGLAPFAERTGRRHVITTQIEHKAVLEPCEELERRGFSVTRLPVTPGGYVEPDEVKKALRKDTVLVSVMQANNETGVLQPIVEITDVLAGHDAYFHVDAAQGFGKELESLRNRRVDIISASGHKIYAPKGVGALIMRRRGFQRPPVQPLMFGGGQERGLRPGTVPVHLVAGFGLAAELCLRDCRQRVERNLAIRHDLLQGLSACGLHPHGDQARCLPHIVNFSIPGLDSEAVMLAWKSVAAVSNGSACTAQSYSVSHVLSAMKVPKSAIGGALRLSWCHLAWTVDITAMTGALVSLR